MHVSRNSLGMWTLSAGLALVFIAFGIDKFANSILWIGFLPAWMDGFLGMSKELWLQVIGVLEMILGLLVLAPIRRVRQAGAFFIAVHLLAIVLQMGWNDVSIRDIGLLTSSIALLLLL